jgi:hypothetical protein
VDESLLQMVEQMGGADMSEMQKNFAAVEECGGMRKNGMNVKLATNLINDFDEFRWHG